jgi:hypothetical protein
VRRSDLDPSHGGADRCVEPLLEAELVDEEGKRFVLIPDVDPDRAYVGDGGRGHGGSPLDMGCSEVVWLSQPDPYISEPGVVSV